MMSGGKSLYAESYKIHKYPFYSKGLIYYFIWQLIQELKTAVTIDVHRQTTTVYKNTFQNFQLSNKM